MKAGKQPKSHQTSKGRKLSFDQFEIVCSSEYDRAVAIARRSGIRNKIDAQAVVHEAMLSMENVRVECVQQFRCALLRRVWSRAKGAYRARARYAERLEKYAEHMPAEMSGSSPFPVEERLEELQSLLLLLADKERLVLRLRLWKGFSVKKVARRLNLLTGTVKSLSSRGASALAKLRLKSRQRLAPVRYVTSGVPVPDEKKCNPSVRANGNVKGNENAFQETEHHQYTR